VISHETTSGNTTTVYDASGHWQGHHEPMMAWQRGYKFSPEEIARHRCLDCGVNVIEIGDYCMVQSEIWRDQFGLGWDDNLCIACIEKRLGRRLTPHDLGFGFTPNVEGYPKSDALVERITPPAKKRRKPRKKPRKR
jgi:hypothetical protein